VARITGREIQQWIDQRIADGVGGTTIRNDLTIISQVYEVNKLDWRVSNPVRECRLPSPGKPRDRRLDAEAQEEKRLLKACRESGHSWLEPLVRLAIDSAMRQGELLDLEWASVRENQIRVVDSKNGEARVVPLSPKGRDVISDLVRDGEKVFPVTQAATEHQFRRACEHAKIEDLRFHDLRHEATSRLFEAGLNIIEVSAITGHKTLQMLKRYTHPRTADLLAKRASRPKRANRN
jgi:integrase